MNRLGDGAQEAQRTGRVEIKLDRSPLDPGLATTLQKVVVEAEINMPAMFWFRLAVGSARSEGDRGPVREIDDRFFKNFQPGTPVEIKLGRGAEGRMLVSGHITALEPNFSESPVVDVRGFDRMYHLRFGARLRHFNEITDSELAETIAGEVGLSVEAESTATAYEYLLQNNQTNYDFLYERARRIGYEMRVEDKKFVYGPPDETAEPAVTLVLGEELQDFSASLKIPTRGSEVDVRGLDLKAADAISSKAPAANAAASGKKKNGFGYAAEPFPESAIAVVDEPLENAGEAEVLAAARRDLELRVFVTGEGRTRGQPKLMPGRTIKLKGLGPRFNGNYYVTAATHTLDEEGYATDFKVRRRKI